MAPSAAAQQSIGPRASCTRVDCAACEVRHQTFCAELNDDEIGHLSAITSQVHLASEQIVFQEGDPTDYLFNVVLGTVRLYKLLPDGRRQITGFLYPGDFLGLASSEGYSYSAEAVSEVCLCRFPRFKLEALIELYPGMGKRILALANDELAVAQDQMLLLGRKTAIEKVASFLLSLSERAAKRGQGATCVSLPMARSEIADYLGLTTETVSRTLTRFKEDGIIQEPTSRKVEIVRRDELELLAES